MQIIKVYELKPLKSIVRRLKFMLICFIKRSKSLTDDSFVIVFIMFRCDYISLLRIIKDKEVCLLNDDRLDRVMQTMINSFA